MRRRDRLTAFCFLATLCTATWEKVHWEPAGGQVALSELFAAAFLVLFLDGCRRRRDFRLSRPAVHVGIFAAAFTLVYLIGFHNVETGHGQVQFAKGLVKFALHMAFFVAGLEYVVHRSVRFYRRSLGWFCAGITVSAAYAIVQLVAARAGHNLDSVVVSPLTGGASRINVYGVVDGSKVYRPNALSGDPNHLAIVLDLPLLVLVPLYICLERGHPLRARLGVLLAFLLVVEFATLSRSGLLGLAAGCLLLVLAYGRRLASTSLLVPLAGAVLVVAFVVSRRLHVLETVLRSRVRTGGGAHLHLAVYDVIPRALDAHPLFGLGLNTFSVYYAVLTGKRNWGPHSFYVSVLVETGLVGAALAALFLGYVFMRLRATQQLGRRLAADGDPVAAFVRPLSWGLTAALVATMAANAFYLTMTFFYFFIFLMLVLAAPIVFERGSRTQDGTPA